MFEVTPLDPNYLVKLDPRTILKAAGTGYPDTLKYVKEQTERGEEISPGLFFGIIFMFIRD